MTPHLPKYVKYYGYTIEQVKALKSMMYEDALNNKINSAKSLLVRLLEVPLSIRDISRINEVGNTIKFNKELLEELTL